MSEKDDYIREQTLKAASVHKRVLNVPLDERKAFAWLVSHLHVKKILSDDDIDTMLWEARRPGL
jgi:hypothetical protein